VYLVVYARMYMVGIYHPTMVHTVHPWVHPRTYSRRRLQCRCISNAVVYSEEALGSGREKPLGESLLPS